MIDESTMTDATQLSPRAAIALLTLQLRSTVQEAVEAEAAADAVDADGALWQLRSRLTPLIDERRRALDEEVAHERARAAEAIAAAHAEADQITSAAIEAAASRALAERAAADLARRDAEWQAIVDESPVVPDVAEPEVASHVEDAMPDAAPLLAAPDPGAPQFDVSPVEADVPDSASEPDVSEPPFESDVPDWSSEPDTLDAASEPDTSEPSADDATSGLDDQTVSWGYELSEPADQPEEAPESAVAPLPLPPPLQLPPPLPPRLAPDTLVQSTTDPAADDELWAHTLDRSDDGTMRVTLDADSFARAFAAAMAPILEARDQQAPQYVLPAPAHLQPQAPPPKRSFWAHAWHPDVLLSGLAMVIVIIVLVAWTG